MQMLDAEALYRLLFSQLIAVYGDTLGRPDGVALVGIRNGGAWLAERLAADLPPHRARQRRLAALERPEVPESLQAPVAGLAHTAAAVLAAARRPVTQDESVELGIVNVALHREDFASKSLPGQYGPTQLPFDVSGRRILLLDDVLYTGRTIRAAINELYEYGRPSSVELAVLVDRGGRELPFAARFAAAKIDVTPGQTMVLARDQEGRFTFNTKSRLD